MKNLKYFSLFILLFIATPAFAIGPFNTDLTVGSTGPDVSDLQQFLKDRGNYSGPITGNFYSLTRAGVIAFQTEKGISPTSGYFGPITRNIVNEILAGTSTEATTTTETTPAVTANSLQDQITALLNEIAQIQNKLSAQNTEITNLASTTQTLASTTASIQNHIATSSQSTSTPVIPQNSLPTIEQLEADGNANAAFIHYQQGQMLTDEAAAWYYNESNGKPIFNATNTPDLTYSLTLTGDSHHPTSFIPGAFGNFIGSVFMSSNTQTAILRGFNSSRTVTGDGSSASATISAIPADQWTGTTTLSDYAKDLNQPVNYGIMISFHLHTPQGNNLTGKDLIDPNQISAILERYPVMVK